MVNTAVAVLSREARHPFGAGHHRVQNPAEMLSERTARASAGNAGGHHVPLGHAQASQMLRYHRGVGRCPPDVEGPHVVAAVTVRPSQIRPRRRPRIVAHQQLVAEHCGLPADSVEALRPAGPGHRRAQIDACPAGQKIERFAEADTVGLLNKRQRVPRSATPKAVVEAPLTVHRHRSGVAVGMERAHGHNRRGGAGPPHLGDLSDEVHKVGSFSDQRRRRRTHAALPSGIGNLRTVCTPPGSARPLAERLYQAQKGSLASAVVSDLGFRGGAATVWGWPYGGFLRSCRLVWLCWYLTSWGAIPKGAGRPTPGRLARSRPCDGAPCYWIERRQRIHRTGPPRPDPGPTPLPGGGTVRRGPGRPPGGVPRYPVWGTPRPAQKARSPSQKARSRARSSLTWGFAGDPAASAGVCPSGAPRLPSPGCTGVPQRWEVAEAGISPLSSLEEGSRGAGWWWVGVWGGRVRAAAGEVCGTGRRVG